MALREAVAAVVLIGALSAIESLPAHTHATSKSHDRIDGQLLVSGLYNRSGLGVGMRLAPTAKLGSLDAHYGWTLSHGAWQWTASPFLGLSYAERFHELPQGAQFSLGLELLGSYQGATLSVSYWHMSNGDALGLSLTNAQNIGLDMLTIQSGWMF